MGDTTTNRAYRKPLSSDPAANLTSYFRNLADDVDADVQALITLLEGTWTTYATNWTGSTTNPSVGTGGSITARYKQVGKTVHYIGKILIGTSGFNIGAGTYVIDLPVAAFNSALVIGAAYIGDASTTANRRGATLRGLSSTTCNFYAGSGNVVTSSSIFTFDASDSLEWSVVYEAA